MKVLIITYYWPPAGGSGVQRWLKFTKYLREFGVEPVIYTVDTDHMIQDESLLKEVPENIEVIKKSIIQPHQILPYFGRKSKKRGQGFLESKPSLLGRIMMYVRANFFIPDARKFWVKPSVSFLSSYLQKNPVDLIITSGPPHSLHLIGLKIKKKMGLKWIADFRDPWVDIFYNDTLKLSNASKRKNIELQKQTLINADQVLTVSKSIQENLKTYTERVEVITNGFDGKIPAREELDNEFSISYIGSLPEESDAEMLWQSLEELCSELPEFKADMKLKLIGNINSHTLKRLEGSMMVDRIEVRGYVPHDEVMNFQSQSQVLLLLIPRSKSAKGIVTGKIFEYLRAKRPILAIGPSNGDAAEIISTTQSGQMFDFDHKEEVKRHLLKLYQKYKQNNLQINSQNIELYHRKNLTKELVRVMNETLSQD